MEPIPLLVSTISFELGVMSLLFSAKSYKDPHDLHDHSSQNKLKQSKTMKDFHTHDECKAGSHGKELCYSEIHVTSRDLAFVLDALYNPFSGCCEKKEEKHVHEHEVHVHEGGGHHEVIGEGDDHFHHIQHDHDHHDDANY